ncbi:YchJ family protein [Marispirochaeta sp.]|jgi:SEC-C motif domain protein|uniref:YchJ family protein n=1 Tax=Marispirochaeta sp. TaxID=2038653 RepID=UPI0029C75807|nr:YchJ family protein [Marispirochaeta sp.]
MSQCPCGSGKSYSACCEPFITGFKKAPAPEALMRSRYSAYTKNILSYIESSHDPETRDSLDLEATSRWAQDSEWLGLTILRTEAGGKGDDKGIVEFEARYRQDGEEQRHHEESIFVQRDGTWYFHDGHKPSLTVIREEPKIGRNDPCPCGSGKKYKKCCGK